MDYAKESLRLHGEWKGKIKVVSKIPVANKEDLSLAYTPGVAQPCIEINKDYNKSFDLTARGNTVAVITDGTAVLGLGDIGPEAGMMLELASGNRSSTGYCSHDFQLTTVVILATDALGILRAWENPELWSRVRVGNEDFFYKNEIGYQGYATGSYGVSTKTHSEQNEGKPYFALKYIWKNFLLPIE